ncbi:MAG: macB 9 [Acidobacteria bacterium]|nr:macB 9 [Acidobacteriota bacterium]
MIALVLGESLLMAAAGLGVGVPAAYSASRTFADLLFGIAPTDIVTYTVAAGALLIVVIVATYVPARRAAAIDPIVALRAE